MFKTAHKHTDEFLSDIPEYAMMCLMRKTHV